MFHDFINLLYPQLCNACGEPLLSNETVICTTCLHELPLTYYHLENENAVKKVFYGRLDIENATSLLLFEKKGMVQQLVHNLKYRGHEEIGEFFGTWMGNELKEIPQYQTITAVVPVPLHKSRLRQRGYNQVEKMGQALAKALGVPYVDSVLVKKKASKTQTVKKRFARWGSIDATFQIENQHLLEKQHVLLIDDLVTTGATLEACALKLLSIPEVKISIATLAIAH